ncbi:MAG: response regulator [Maioricimonas sp. JB049]
MARFLVVDDSARDRRIAGGLLEKHDDWIVYYAKDGEEALPAIEEHLPDMVVTDLQMPRMNGLELVSRVREEFPLIPVILMTAQGSETIAVEALERGAASYVPKRELAQDLVETIERVLSLASEHRGSQRLLQRLTCERFILENDAELISNLVRHVRQAVVDRFLFDATGSYQVATALDEALTNAYFHGNLEVDSALKERDDNAFRDLAEKRRHLPPYIHRRIHVETHYARERVSFVVRDEGPGFDPRSVPDPTVGDNLDRASGRGLLLMRTFMDEMTFNETGNEVTLVKRTSPPETSD